jgi:3-deoxy-D-manno-octulosonate 8-phosphate phosphatase (KDO 8-P phosphatase)
MKSASFSGVRLIVFDFDGVFTDNTVYIDQNGIESVRCWRSDGLGLERIKRQGIPTYIISTEENPVVLARAKKLNVPCMNGIKDKAEAIQRLSNSLGIELTYTMFVGNDINDLPALKIVGYPVAVADAYPELIPHVVYQTQKPGGRGAVREICDLLFETSIDAKREQIV